MPENLFGSFDISMSFGLVEHFTYPQRLQVLKLHSGLIKSGGIAFVAAPNANCWPYRLFMVLSNILGYSFEKREIPFTRAEFKKNALPAGFNQFEIVGSSFIRDSAYFLFAKYISHLAKWKLILDITFLEIPTFFDDYFGYSLVFIGSKI
jgi:hypothetical protein